MDRLRAGDILIADGATGTMLQAMGLPAGTAPEQWNIEKPDAIRAHHRAYLDAGSQIILTNTFGGSRLKLERSTGLAGQAVATNRAAAALAKKEATDQAYVAGDIGPTGELLAPLGVLSQEEAIDVFAEQALALVEGGVDLLWIETMADLGEATAAIKGVKQVTNLPVFCSLSFGKSGRTMMGVTPASAFGALWSLGLAAIGANCGEGIDPVVRALVEIRSASKDAILIAKPNAGLPHLDGDETVFDLTPEGMAGHVPYFVELGAQIIGGCCGSSPEHIAAMAAALSKSKPALS
jgi:5-methyltetrahydrofolate--homocysteine methyltransferase